MLRRAVQQWSALQRNAGQTSVQRALRCVHSLDKAPQINAADRDALPPSQRSHRSDAAPGSRSRLAALTEESETAHKLFENVKLPAEALEGSTAGAAGGAAAADAAAVDTLEHSAAGRVLSALGNALFFGSVAAASFFGYYSYRYDVDQVERMVEETQARPENAFPGSSVRVAAARERRPLGFPALSATEHGCTRSLASAGCIPAAKPAVTVLPASQGPSPPAAGVGAGHALVCVQAAAPGGRDEEVRGPALRPPAARPAPPRAPHQDPGPRPRRRPGPLRLDARTVRAGVSCAGRLAQPGVDARSSTLHVSSTPRTRWQSVQPSVHPTGAPSPLPRSRSGWRTFKRPGVEDFIRSMAQYYELVVYTSQLPTYADPVMDRLDPQRLVQYRLYRDSTQYVGGRHVRDLSKLNRDMRQVLFVTADPDAYALQPENAIKVGAACSGGGSEGGAGCGAGMGQGSLAQEARGTPAAPVLPMRS